MKKSAMKIYNFIFLSLVMICFSFSCNAKTQKKSYVSVSMEEGLKMLSETEGAVLLDVRRDDEYSSGHIPGAVLLTNETMTEEKVLQILPSKETPVFVYCRSGRRSKEASQKLSDYGYTKVTEIGGILDYTGKLE